MCWWVINAGPGHIGSRDLEGKLALIKGPALIT